MPTSKAAAPAVGPTRDQGNVPRPRSLLVEQVLDDGLELGLLRVAHQLEADLAGAVQEQGGGIALEVGDLGLGPLVADRAAIGNLVLLEERLDRLLDNLRRAGLVVIQADD